MLSGIDPLSVLIGVPILGPIVAWYLKDSRDGRREYHAHLAELRVAHAAQLERMHDAYQELAGKVQDNFSRVIAENTAATKALEKSIDGIVERVLNRP